MGKKKKISKDEFNRGLYSQFYGPGSEARDMLKRYNVEGAISRHPDGRSGKSRSVAEVREDLAAAMMNDYDTRRTMEAAAMSGNKDAKKFAKKGFDSGNLQDAYGVMRDLKKEYVGGGGMDGAKNRAGLTHALVNADRDNFTESLSGMFGSNDPAANAAEDPAPTKTAYSYNDYMKGTFGSAEDSAQDLLAGTVKGLSDAGATDKAKAKQGQYVLKNLGADEFQS